MKFWKWFYGTDNVYWLEPAPKYFKWFPQIMTIAWWRWCLSRGWTPLARERIRYYYQRKISRRVLRYPICLVLGHSEYDSSNWGYIARACARCSRTTFYQKIGKSCPSL